MLPFWMKTNKEIILLNVNNKIRNIVELLWIKIDFLRWRESVPHLNLYKIVNITARDLKPSVNYCWESNEHDDMLKNAVGKVEIGEIKARK